MLKALFIDFDGTILDTESPEVESWRDIFREHGLEYPDEHWKFCIGRGADLILEQPEALLRRMLGRDVDVWGQKERVLAMIEQQPVRPGVESLMAECKEAALPIVVVSSSKRNWVSGYLVKRDLNRFVTGIVCADDVSRPKPFPDLYLEAMARFRVTCPEAMTIEDSPNGIAAAKAAGLVVLATPNMLTVQLDLSAADFIEPDLEHLRLDWFRKALDLRTA